MLCSHVTHTPSTCAGTCNQLLLLLLCYVLMLQTLQVAAGGMHSVALTEDFQLYTTGVNDEGALGRFTGAFTLLHEPHIVIHVRLI